ncbi:MAG: MFS transporter [Haloferacaceae archaeon]
MNPTERRFVFTLGGAHAVSHVFRRLLPPLIPVLTIAFGYPLWKLGLLAGAFSLGSGLGQTPVGILSDRRDRRYILSAGLALVSTCYALFALVPRLGLGEFTVAIAGYSASLEFLIMLAVMLVGGSGTSVLHPTGYPLLSENVAAERKGRALGVFGGAAKFGDAVAPMTIGALLLVVTWPTILVGIGALGLVYAAGLFVFLSPYETRPAGGRVSEDDADADREPLDRRAFVYPILAIFLFFSIRMVAAGGVNVFIPQFITSVYGFSISIAGARITPQSAASFYYAALLITAGITQLGTGAVVDRYDGRLVLLAFLGTATLVLTLLATTILSPALLFLALLLLGASMWGLNPARDALISEITPADREGRTFGYLWTGALVIGSVSPVLVGYIGDTAGLQQAFAILAAVTVLSAVPIALLLSPRVYLRDATGKPGSTAQEPANDD